MESYYIFYYFSSELASCWILSSWNMCNDMQDVYLNTLVQIFKYFSKDHCWTIHIPWSVSFFTIDLTFLDLAFFTLPLIWGSPEEPYSPKSLSLVMLQRPSLPRHLLLLFQKHFGIIQVLPTLWNNEPMSEFLWQILEIYLFITIMISILECLYGIIYLNILYNYLFNVYLSLGHWNVWIIFKYLIYLYGHLFWN